MIRRLITNTYTPYTPSYLTYLHKQNKQTDQTTTLCVQEVEIYLERWEVLGALVDVSVGARATNTNYLYSCTLLTLVTNPRSISI